MDTNTRQKITDELRLFLNREPTEKEIMNGQTDINIMHKVRIKIDIEEKKVLEDKIDLIKINPIK